MKVRARIFLVVAATAVAVAVAGEARAAEAGEGGGNETGAARGKAERSEVVDTTVKAGAVVVAAAGPVVIEARGRVLVRAAEGGRYRGRAAAGRAVAAGEVLLTGPDARVELGFGEGGRWRVGQQAFWRALGGGGDAALNAGSALVAVPAGRTTRVAGAEAVVRLGEGVWLLTAVANNGLKIVALDRGTAECETGAAGAESAAAGEAGRAGVESVAAGEAGRAGGGWEERRMKAGEVVFARPGGRGFGPVVTVFLDELLTTSRLVGGFAAELPQAERLRQQGAAQREGLKNVSNAFVGGARDADGFQLVVPKARAEKASGEAGSQERGGRGR